MSGENVADFAYTELKTAMAKLPGDIPHVLGTICLACWVLTVEETRALWKALRQSRWSRPTKLRHALALPGYVPVDLTHFALHVLTPEIAIGVIDDLMQEKVLSHAIGVGVQEKMLTQVTAQGEWKQRTTGNME